MPPSLHNGRMAHGSALRIRVWHVSLSAAVSLTVLIVLCLGLVPSGCGKPSASGADAGALLAEAVAPMEALSSFHFTYTVIRPADAPAPPGTEIAGIEGDVSLEGLMEAVVDVNQSGVPLQFKFIATNDVHYVQNPASQEWQSVPASLSPVGDLNLSAGAVLILERVQQPTEAGAEKVGDTACVKVVGKIAAQDIADLVSAADAQELLDCTIWLGKDDHLVRRIQTVGAAVSGEDKRLKRLIELSAFNEAVDIQLPPSTG